MNIIFVLACLGVGILLIIFGINSSDSISSSFSKFFNNSPTDKTVWLLAGGVALFIVGLGGLFFKTGVQ